VSVGKIRRGVLFFRETRKRNVKNLANNMSQLEKTANKRCGQQFTSFFGNFGGHCHQKMIAC
jgi:hypothetical protein